MNGIPAGGERRAAGPGVSAAGRPSARVAGSDTSPSRVPGPGRGCAPLAQALLERLWASRTGTLSTQILQEFYAVATRKFDPPMSRRAAREIVAVYAAWPLVQVDLPLILTASQLEEQHGLSFWDALVVEAARRAGASRLATEDLQGGRLIGGVRIENPFL